MNYRDAYCHLRGRLEQLMGRLEQPRVSNPPGETAAYLRRLIVESDELLLVPTLLPPHKAARRGSSQPQSINT